MGNGFADGPSQALRDYLIKHKAKRVTTISHPLVAEGSGKHVVSVFENNAVRTKEIPMPHKPPLTYIFDPFVPLRLPDSTAWFGFNNLAAYRGLIRRKRGKTNKVYYWAVDFVPNRFGVNPITAAYKFLDKYVCNNVDARIELSQAALEGRNKYLSLDNSVESLVVPMGAWLDTVPKVSEKCWSEQKIVYLGHLVERQGVNVLVRALSVLESRGSAATLDIIGAGPEKEALEALVAKLGLAKKVKFHGFVESHQEVEKILSQSTVAAAPYKQDKDSFTQYADPGKLKAYLGAGLPIVLTPVPPNAYELEKAGVAKIVKDSPESLANGLEELLSKKSTWLKSHNSALSYSKNFDWEKIIKDALNEVGFY